METQKLETISIKTVIENGQVYIPIKLFCEDLQIDFDSTMIYFNKFKLEVEFVPKKIEEKEYLCFSGKDFIVFLVIVQALDVRIKKYVNRIIGIVSNHQFKISKNNKYLSFDTTMNRLIRKPLSGEDFEFVTASELCEKLSASEKKHINNQNIGMYLMYKGYKRTAKRTINGSRYGYEVVLLPLQKK
jgi:hypothetical protein